MTAGDTGVRLADLPADDSDARLHEWVREQLAAAPPITEQTLRATAAHLRDHGSGGPHV